MNMLETLMTGGNLLTSIPKNLIFKHNIETDIQLRNESSWAEEKKELLERANWLCDQVIVKPEKLLNKMPSLLGKFYGGQWAIYSCSMLTAALSNIAYLYPEVRQKCIRRMDKLIYITLSPAIRQYDTMAWREDALASLQGDKSHMTYLSILSWMITNFKMAGGSGKYDAILHACCEAMNRRMWKSPDLNLLSFPNKPIFFPDMLFAIAALHNYSQLYDGMYADSVSEWLKKAKSEWLNKKNGLLVSMLKHNCRPLRGSYSALNCYCLSLIDEGFASDQYQRLKSIFLKEEPVVGIKEFVHKCPNFKLDVDAGPIVMGISPSGTTFALGCATYLEDWEMRSLILRTAEIAGNTIQEKNSRHYKLGEMFLVGEAAALATRTNIKKHL